jgi:endonuclease/exonuclease/phosphatase family metal-dependent hydrolase
MRVLVWNLFHGRADPPAGRPLLHEFAELLARWEWDIALLQEVPPWWPPLLARRCAAESRTALTSRNQLLPLRRAIASRAPDRLKSNGGGANAILVRTPWTITAHARRRLRIRPERRVVHAVRVALPRTAPGSVGAAGGRAADGSPGDDGPRLDRCAPFAGAWVGNLHAQLGRWDSAEGLAAPLADLRRATAQLEAWAYAASPPADRHEFARGRHDSAAPSAAGPSTGPADAPLLLGGDFNLPRDVVATQLPAGWTRIASSGPDHVAGRGVRATGASQRPDRGTLSDHAPLLIEIEIAARCVLPPAEDPEALDRP